VFLRKVGGKIIKAKRYFKKEQQLQDYIETHWDKTFPRLELLGREWRVTKQNRSKVDFIAFDFDADGICTVEIKNILRPNRKDIQNGLWQAWYYMHMSKAVKGFLVGLWTCNQVIKVWPRKLHDCRNLWYVDLTYRLPEVVVYSGKAPA